MTMEFPDPNDLLNFTLTIAPDEGTSQPALLRPANMLFALAVLDR
jgi:hypothetical protein